MAMRTLIVGARGMLGSMLVKVLEDWQPIGWDKEELDITDADQVREVLKELQPKVVINAAAYTDVDGAETNRDLAFSVNEGGVKNLAEVAKEIDALLVHYSTDYVFPGDKAGGYTESDSPGPAINVYGESKLAGERALIGIKPKFILQRSAWLYGPNGKNFVQTMLDLAKKTPSLSVVSDQHGSPTYTKDVAIATKTLIEENYPSGIYHTVNSGQATWFDFAQKIFEYSDQTADVKPTTSAEFPRPAKRPAYSVLVNTKGPLMRSWQSALDDYMHNQ